MLEELRTSITFSRVLVEELCDERLKDYASDQDDDFDPDGEEDVIKDIMVTVSDHDYCKELDCEADYDEDVVVIEDVQRSPVKVVKFTISQDVIEDLSEAGYASDLDPDYEPNIEEVAIAEEEDLETESGAEDVVEWCSDEDDEVIVNVSVLDIKLLNLPDDVLEDLSEYKLTNYVSEDDEDYKPSFKEIVEAEREEFDSEVDQDVTEGSSDEASTTSDDEEQEVGVDEVREIKWLFPGVKPHGCISPMVLLK